MDGCVSNRRGSLEAVSSESGGGGPPGVLPAAALVSGCAGGTGERAVRAGQSPFSESQGVSGQLRLVSSLSAVG